MVSIMTRPIFYVSDSTAMTAKGLGKSLLSQFDNLLVMEYLRPFIDSKDKVLELVNEINAKSFYFRHSPVVFASIMDEDLIKLLSSSINNVINIIEPFTKTLEAIINERSSKAVGRAHQVSDLDRYKRRLEAIDFSLATDDGLRRQDYDKADIIILGVSRSGKTPTALYLALNFNLKVANYPFTTDDLPKFFLTNEHKKNRHKLIGLMISEERLLTIRRERYEKSTYANPVWIHKEVFALMELYKNEQITFIDSTTRSVEEIAALILRIYELNSQ
jgi:regulator of PEP synthase PpsR (kinase-PPPase family)